MVSDNTWICQLSQEMCKQLPSYNGAPQEKVPETSQLGLGGSARSQSSATVLSVLALSCLCLCLMTLAALANLGRASGIKILFTAANSWGWGLVACYLFLRQSPGLTLPSSWGTPPVSCLKYSSPRGGT